MFEQAVLENCYANRRAFATGAGFAGQAALAACIVIAPMIWPQVLPRPRLTMMVSPPTPAPPSIRQRPDRGRPQRYAGLSRRF